MLSLYALWRMGYLSADCSYRCHLTDSSRTAYVAKHIVEGHGYKTNDLPAYLIDYYDEHGKLHDDYWTNSDRFPFTAYAIAALYTLTGSTDDVVGIVVYNLLCFVGFLIALYALARTVWHERYSALFALGFALLHPYTYVFLYQKDSDTLFLTTACLACFYRYANQRRDATSSTFSLGFGTMLGWSVLARPNIGLPLIACFGWLMVRNLLRDRRELGIGRAVGQLARRDGLIAFGTCAWLLPFIVHSISEWGAPLFTGNSLYQLPLGTRYGMGTDTWWKYTDPNWSVGARMIFDGAGAEIWSKFPSSWFRTTKQIAGSYVLELCLALGLAMSYRRSDPVNEPAAEPARQINRGVIWWVTGVVVLANFALLPAFSYQSFGFQHYLSFGVPAIWLAAGRAVYVLARTDRASLAGWRSFLNARRRRWVLAAAIVVLIVNFALHPAEANALLANSVSLLLFHHWWLLGALLMLVVLRRWLVRPPHYPRVVAVTMALVFALYEPRNSLIHWDTVFAPTDLRAYDVLRERKGLVSSFALQCDVAWATDRKNIPAPEYLMHIYSFALDHRLDVQDVYIESAEAMLEGFREAAPGFEQYVRLQRHHAKLPGYELAFQASGERRYPGASSPVPKSATVYRKADAEAFRAITSSPDRIAIGEADNLIYTAHGFDSYYSIDDRPVVAATDITRKRYTKLHNGLPGHRPWEDTSITFFLSERRPRSVTLEFYTFAPNVFDFYWNLDLYAYDRPGDRPSHHLGRYRAERSGWHTVKLSVPHEMTRTGLNKLGFRAEAMAPVVTCPDHLAVSVCLSKRENANAAVTHPNQTPAEQHDPPSGVLRSEQITNVVSLRVSMLATSLAFEYPVH